jgi:hypothetical protein
MKFSFALSLTAIACAAAICFSASLREAEAREVDVDATRPDRDEVDTALRSFILYGLVPLWMLPGFCDYLCHRSSKIERTSGTHESLTHILMIGCTGGSIGAGLVLEVNEAVLCLMTFSALAHEAIVLWDVGYAAKLRPPSATEQHCHSFLEVLPFAALVSTACLYPRAALSLMRGGLGSVRPAFKRKQIQPPPEYLTAVALAGTAALALPYAEEFIRCFRVDHTLLPHRINGDASHK